MDFNSEGTGNGAIESSLLQQFSCMGTTDKEELVAQLQKFVGNLTYASATFFLDMNNWNLQAAICSYLDVEKPSKLPCMTLLSDPVACETDCVEPKVCFQKCWYINNSGEEPWPSGCYAQCSDGASLGSGRVPVPCLRPGEGIHLAISMVAPDRPGLYQTKWRLCTPCGSYFGDPLWAIISVTEEGTMALTQQLLHFNELGAPSAPQNVSHNPFITSQHSTLPHQDTTFSNSGGAEKRII